VRDGEGNVIEDEQVLVNEEQAAVIREVVRRVIANERIMAICNDLNERGIKTRDGRRWRQGNLAPILAKSAIAGLVFHPELPELVKARWPAIISEADWRKLQAVITNPDRRQNLVTGRTALLTGFVYCGAEGCGKKLVASRDQRGKRVYVCKKDSHRQGCGRLKRLADPVDQLIGELVVSALEDSDFKIPTGSDDDEFAHLWAQKKELDDSLAQLAIDHYRLGVIKRAPYLAANEALEADLAAVQRRLDRATTYRHVKEIPVGEIAQQEWDAHEDDLQWRRELVSLVLQGRKIIVKPSAHLRVRYSEHFRARFDPESIDFDPPIVPQDHDAIAQ
jgi:hypothetical protein